MEVNKMKITCPVCKKEFPVRKPEAPGMYKIVCTNPECAHEIKLMIRAREVKMAGNTQQPQQQTAKAAAAPQIPMVGTPEKTEKGIYLLKTALHIGKKVAYTCPTCGKHVVLMPKTTGAMAAACPACATRTAFRVVDPSPQPAADVPKSITKRNNPIEVAINNQKVELVWGSLFCRKKAVLKEGINWVGRKEPANPSDIMIDDPAVSAHSFSIEKNSQNGTCKLYVQHATNPVKINGVECKEGCTVYLNFGDKILTGKTVLVVAKSK